MQEGIRVDSVERSSHEDCLRPRHSDKSRGASCCRRPLEEDERGLVSCHKSASEIEKLYGRRFTIEETFRDQKNWRFGLGLSATHIGDVSRRDRLLLLAAISQALLTLLGAAGEKAGLDRLMKTNTSKKRTMSLLNQGINLYAAIPNMGDDRLGPLMKEFDASVREHEIFRKIFGLI